MTPVIYLTGAPATGKSTLSRSLSARHPDLLVFAYSEMLRGRIAAKQGGAVGEDLIREKSSHLVTPEDVAQLDRDLIELVRSQRSTRPILIDSHPVTKETYGFRITSFSIENLRALNPDVIICLYADSTIIRQRIEGDPMGRPQVTNFEATMHTQLQAGVAAQYGLLLGIPVYLIDSSITQEELVRVVADRTRLHG